MVLGIQMGTFSRQIGDVPSMFDCMGLFNFFIFYISVASVFVVFLLVEFHFHPDGTRPGKLTKTIEHGP